MLGRCSFCRKGQSQNSFTVLKDERTLLNQCFYLSCLNRHLYHIQARKALKYDGQQLGESWRSAKDLCHRKTCCTSGMDRVVCHSEMPMYRTLMRKVHISSVRVSLKRWTAPTVELVVLSWTITHTNCAFKGKPRECLCSVYLVMFFDSGCISLNFFHLVEI